MTNPLPPPDFVIIGAMKAATSTLHDQLDRQPGVVMSEPKEPCFFSDDEVHARGFDWYESCFRHSPDARARGESSTHYAKLPKLPRAAERLHARRPDARILYVIRQPIDRLVSHFMHGWSEGWYRGTILDAVREDRSLIDYGRYAMQLAPWLERFGAGRILLVPYDGISERPQEELERVGEFLGLHGPLRWRDDLAPRNVSRERVRQGWLRRCFIDPAWATSLRRVLVPRGWRDRIRMRMQMRERPTLSIEDRHRLADAFDADLATLSQWLGRSIRCGDFREQTLGRPLDWTPETLRRFPGLTEARAS